MEGVGIIPERCLRYGTHREENDASPDVFIYIDYLIIHHVLLQEEGLQVLILDKNPKFSDVALRQLIRMLKHDFWLKTLCLRCCGITQHGGEIALELLQTNSVLTHIDLRDNEISSDVLHIIRKILRKRKSKGERIPMKKRLLNCKHALGQEIISKKVSSECIPKDKDLPQKQVVNCLRNRVLINFN